MLRPVLKPPGVSQGTHLTEESYNGTGRDGNRFVRLGSPMEDLEENIGEQGVSFRWVAVCKSGLE